MQKVLFFIFTIILLYPFMEINEDKYTIVFPKEYIKTAKKTANMLDAYIPLYNKYYNYTLDDKILFFINKSNQQRSNGYALFNKIRIFSGSAKILKYDLSTTNEWAKHLIIHELAHSYQLLSNKFPLKRKILKNGVFFVLEPNIFTPLSFIEGNAVLMESLFNNGGRLHSGYSRALLNAMINDDKITSNLLLLNTKIFPYYNTRYLIGGFFMQYLYNAYGINKVNSYFLNHSNSYLNPFSLGFKEQFNDNFEYIFNNFIKYHKKDKFIKSKGEIITKSGIIIDLNKQNNEIYFLSSKVYGKNTLNIFDITTNKIQKQKSIFYDTRVFKIDNKFYFVKNENINNEIFYGLYDESFNLLKGSKSKIFTSIVNKNRYYFDANNSFNKLRLYKNGDFIDEIDSSNIVDDNGDLYYFKNINKKRWLIKNKKKIISFDGYYSFVVDKDKNYIYFISNSSGGSSLFAWDKAKKEVIRVFKGDDIYNAKKINNDYFLISVITSDSHKLLKAKGLYFKEKANKNNLHLDRIKLKIKNKDFKINSYNPWASIGINSINLDFSEKQYISLFASDVTDKIKLYGSFGIYKNIYLYTLKYQNDYNDNFKHEIVSETSGQFDVLLFKSLYKNDFYRKGNAISTIKLGYENLYKRKNKHSLLLSLKYNNILFDISDSHPSSGYNMGLYANKIISDGLNIKGYTSFYKKISKNFFLNLNMQSAFSTSKAYKNKISIEDNNIQNEHIKADNYAGVTFNDVIVKTNIKLDYDKYLGFYSKYYLSLVKTDVFISNSNFQSENDSFNENIFGIKSLMLIGYNHKFDFIVKTIYNSIYGRKYKIEISVGL